MIDWATYDLDNQPIPEPPIPVRDLTDEQLKSEWLDLRSYRALSGRYYELDRERTRRANIETNWVIVNGLGSYPHAK